MTPTSLPATTAISSSAGTTVDPTVAFTNDEYDSRLDRLRGEMARDGLAALLVVGPENIYYLTGLNHQGYFAFTMLVVPSEGPLLLVARAMEAVTIGVQARGCVHVPFADYEDPAEAAGRALRSVTRKGGRVGVEQSSMYLPVAIWERLRPKFADLRPVNGSGLVERLREVKSPAEVAYIRRAAAASSRAMEAGIAAVADEVPERDVAAAVYAEMIRAGSEYPGFAPLIRSRAILLQEHVTWGEGTVAKGDAVFMELSASVGRYHAPLTRMVYVGDPPSGTQDAADIATAGLEAVRTALHPGATSGQVYDAWQQVIDHGLGHSTYRRHHCGYMVGIGFPPSWVGGAAVVGLRRGGAMEIREGMTFHVLSWILDQKPADYVVSDTVLVTGAGGEILTTPRREPIVAR